MVEAATLPAGLPAADGERERPLRLHAIGCEVLARPLSVCAARSPHVVDVSFLRRGLHDTPATLRGQLQAEIDAGGAADPPYDATVLVYGLCGGATAGIAAAGIPLVVPRAHDCITIFLGSRERYERESAAHPGTYWYAGDDADRSAAGRDDAALGLLGIGASSDAELRAVHAAYVERFGRDNADYLMEAMGAWRARYERAAFVDLGLDGSAEAERRAREEAASRGWRFERLAGELVLLRRLLAADWADDFLVLQPGQRLAMAYDADVVRAVNG